MNLSSTWIRGRIVVAVVSALLGATALAVVLLFWPAGRGALGQWAAAISPQSPSNANQQDHDDHDHDDHGHAHGGPDHAGHDDATAIELSDQAQRNIGLRTGRIELSAFERTITVPAMVVDRAGWTEIEVAAPMTGIVTRIDTSEGEAVTAGTTLFEIRLTHEELVAAQAEFLRCAEELDVVRREIARLEAVVGGIVAGKTVLEQKYQEQKLLAALKSQREGLMLHGFSDEQVDGILDERTLLHTLTVQVPEPVAPQQGGKPRLLYVQNMPVRLGQHVLVGDRLCRLADHAELYIEGKAFEHDAAALNEAANHDREVTAVFESSRDEPQVVSGLKILYLANKVDAESRALPFYTRLPNELVRDVSGPTGHRFISWRFKPGQRLKLRVPVEAWNERIVLPVEAIAREGAETYVFQKNGDHFDRCTVHIEYQDQFWAVVANDGSIYPGDEVVLSGAHQMHLALKNKSGRGTDPHAGHTH